MSIQKEKSNSLSTSTSSIITYTKNIPSFTGNFNRLSKLPLPAKQKSVQSIEHNPHTLPTSRALLHLNISVIHPAPYLRNIVADNPTSNATDSRLPAKSYFFSNIRFSGRLTAQTALFLQPLTEPPTAQNLPVLAVFSGSPKTF